MSSKNYSLPLIGAALSLLSPCPIHAMVEVVNPNTVLSLSTVFAGKPIQGGTDPWIAVSLTDMGDHTVALTFQAPGLPGNESVSKIFLNLNPALNLTHLGFSITDNTAGLTTIAKGNDAFRTTGSGYFDLLFSFPPTCGGRFTAGNEVTVYASSSDALSTADFLYPSTLRCGAGQSYTVAARLRGMACTERSTWVGAAGYSPIPEPASLAAWIAAVALVATILIQRRSVTPA